MQKITDREIDLLIRYYIGVQGHGWLNGISTVEQLRYFYQVDCDLDLEPTDDNSIVVEFVRILDAQSPQNQARILRAALDVYFVYSSYEPGTTQEKLRPRLEEVANRLESESTLIESASPKSTSDAVRALLEEAANAIHRGRIPRAVDRIHTALHAHIRHICDESNISYGKSPKIKPLFAKLREKHPAFDSNGPRSQDIEKTLDSLTHIVDALGPIRNQASLSHPPEEDLLHVSEATLVVNAVTTVFNYIDEKVAHFPESERASAGELPVDEVTFDTSTSASIDDIPF